MGAIRLAQGEGKIAVKVFVGNATDVVLTKDSWIHQYSGFQSDSCSVGQSFSLYLYLVPISVSISASRALSLASSSPPPAQSLPAYYVGQLCPGRQCQRRCRGQARCARSAAQASRSPL